MNKIFTILTPNESKVTSVRKGPKIVAITYEGEDIDVTDGYHTMHELYQHRMALNIALFNTLICGNDLDVKEVMKSKLHNDGTMFEGYFIVLAYSSHLGRNQISYHYDIKYWDEFTIPEVERIPFPYDGHTSQDVIERLLKL